MNCKVNHLDKNMRYRILIINSEQYILDMERSFWKIIFPFLFWLTPSPVFKVEDQDIVEELKMVKKEKLESSWILSLGGFGYAIGILLAPLMDYFNIPSSPLINNILLIIAIALTAFLYFGISYRRQKKLQNIVELKELPRSKLWIRPSSTNLVFKFLTAYICLLGFVSFLFLGFIDTRNIMILIIASGFFFLLLLANRPTVDEGNTTVKFKDYEKAV
ncbi:hypothetical conserved protein [Oceanobacillus iheyensis HTE831]|uniref:Hypothetical conserved protein n=1 Tax=Oceanobacillus iheyensis (strain DSM 14371 / CIP 107618 / JCM 11309 / KCTC 3954 / HTE831) TaxID=221109 RepID=Q8ERH2_OCEIH|nr:DUF443 domain-containing protein [Oceanobacillus iheyensis]BAC13286.1 hypothetical conserved protein [Oceanobacillus iheyensis HTE831]